MIRSTECSLLLCAFAIASSLSCASTGGAGGDIGDADVSPCGALSFPRWSAAKLVDQDRITLQVEARNVPGEVRFIIMKNGVRGPLDIISVVPSGGKAAARWWYDCAKHRDDTARSLPQIYFIAETGTPPCRVRSATIPVSSMLRFYNRDGFGAPVIVKYTITGRSKKGEVLHQVTGESDKNGTVERTDLIPCIDYSFMPR
jgi:hypothetical protein